MVTSTQLTRRRFMALAATLGAAAGARVVAGESSWGNLGASPFTLGVASGDPLPSAVVLWTRLAPDPLSRDGMVARDFPVRWQVATDEHFRKVVRHGTATASPRLAHSVHVDVRGLEPSRWYWYRFRTGSHISPVGRTRTAPAFHSSPSRMRFAFTSCQNWQHGFYSAYEHLAGEDLEFILHLGDYIYESGPLPGAPRTHEGPEVFDLEGYRNRHALYKTDPSLQAAHASCPFIVAFDDHEAVNNYAGDGLEGEAAASPEFLRRRAAAYQAYWEHLPLRRASLPSAAHMSLYRRFDFGDLMRLNVLDTRQHRTPQPCRGSPGGCEEAHAPGATMLGDEQELWLRAGLADSRSHWNVMAQQTMMARLDLLPDSAHRFNMDQWDGYAAARHRLLDFVARTRTRNPMVLTGDMHSSWVADLKLDFDDPDSSTVATELVGTSISSVSPTPFNLAVKAALPGNPHIRFFDGDFRGYARCTVEPGSWRVEHRAVASAFAPRAPMFTLASFDIEDGIPGAERA